MQYQIANNISLTNGSKAILMVRSKHSKIKHPLEFLTIGYWKKQLTKPTGLQTYSENVSSELIREQSTECSEMLAGDSMSRP